MVYACEQARVQLFSEASFEWESYDGRRFTDKALQILETPWPNAVTSDLLMGMLLDADLGDGLVHRAARRHARPPAPGLGDGHHRPARVDPRRQGCIGYAYQPGGPGSGHAPIVFLREQVAHFKTSPDPLSPHRGMVWLNAVIREIAADIGHDRA